MSRFDEDTSTMRMRLAAAPIELQRREREPPPRARGIAAGVLLGAIMWAANHAASRSGGGSLNDDKALLATHRHERGSDTQRTRAICFPRSAWGWRV
jgi:hypothetical protein